MASRPAAVPPDRVCCSCRARPGLTGQETSNVNLPRPGQMARACKGPSKGATPVRCRRHPEGLPNHVAVTSLLTRRCRHPEAVGQTQRREGKSFRRNRGPMNHP